MKASLSIGQTVCAQTPSEIYTHERSIRRIEIKGETVLDLGSGAGFDCFLAANIVREEGAVIGVDMTPEMINKARANARSGGYTNVEFRLGELEHLPAADSSVDVVISNCVINLTPDKGAVFKEAFRVLKPGGRFAVSDIVVLKALPEAVIQSVAAYVGCLSGAILVAPAARAWICKSICPECPAFASTQEGTGSRAVNITHFHRAVEPKARATRRFPGSASTKF